MNSLLTDNVWFSSLGSRLLIENELGFFVYFRFTAGNSVSDPHITTLGEFIMNNYCISKLEETLLGRLGRLSEYFVNPNFRHIRYSNPDVHLSESYVILGKKVSLNSLAMMTDLEFEEIITTLTFTPDLL